MNTFTALRALPLRALPLLALFSTCGFGGPLSISLNSSLLAAARGQTVTFSATVLNTSASTLFLNSDSLNITAPLTGDDTKFFLNFPLSLAAGQSAIAPIFDITVPIAAPLGLYPGEFDILGGSTPNSLDTLATATFAVNVVPEPATISTLLVGALALGVLRARKRL